MSAAPDDGTFVLFTAVPEPDAEIEVLEITELSPANGAFAGKRILLDNTIMAYPSVRDWRQAVARISIGIVPLYHYLREARTRNIILIRGAPVDLSIQPTRRLKTCFDDLPTRLFFGDVDGAPFNWRDDPEGAVKQIVAQFGEPFASASFVWMFSASHGLGTETIGSGAKARKRWIDNVVTDGKVHVRLAFILDRPLNSIEADALTKIMQGRVGFRIDECISRTIQPNYIRRMYWTEHPERDPLGDVGIPTIGWVKGERETVTVPGDLVHQARWARAQGHNTTIADHPDALSAVLGIGSDGRIRQHMLSAIGHLIEANKAPDHISYIDSLAVADRLAAMIAQHQEVIRKNLAAYSRSLSDVEGHLPDMPAFARWKLERPSIFKRKTIKLVYEARAAEDGLNAEAVFDRVRRTIEGANEGVTLVIAPPGTRKSTLIRAKAKADVRAHPGESVVILVPRIKLGDEQIEALYREHPDKVFVAKVRRGRHQDDPEFIGPQQPGEPVKMCRRDKEADDLEKHLLSVKEHLCKKGKNECAFRKLCGAQRQETVMADIWFAAHEMIVHGMPKVFGQVGRVYIDEDLRDAFMFGTDDNAPFELDLDTLRTPLKRGGANALLTLMPARRALYRTMNKLEVPDDPHRGVPVRREHLQDFFPDPTHPLGLAKYDPAQMAALEWKDKVVPPIRPNMTKREIDKLLKPAEGNGRVLQLAMMWRLIAEGGGGRIQIHQGKHGRIIRMVGLKPVAKDWKDLPTLICDGTGDATLYRAIWPDLKCEVEDDWRQLPRPEGVPVFQCVDKALSKYMIAIEDEGEKLATRQRAARRLWGALLAKAVEYGGQDVGVVIYKSTREWIEKNCHVPSWIKLAHHVTGSNKLSSVRALFVIGRTLVPAEAVTRQTEALFGDYIADREYRKKPKQGRIPIPRNAAGDNTVLVDVWQHPNPLAERVRRQGTEGQTIQAVERARAGLRGADNPLDIHLWTDVPLPELGAVEPVLWADQDDGLDAVMLAAGGVWLESVPQAAKAYQGLFSAKALEVGRYRAQAGGHTTFPIRDTYRECSMTSPLRTFCYQLAGKGQKPTHAASLLGPAETKAWLEARLGPLVKFEEVAEEEPAVAAE